MITIHSKKFILRPFKKGDESSLIENINNRKIAKNTSAIPYPYKLKDARSWIKSNLKLNKKKKKPEINFAIDISEMVVGGIGFRKIEGHKAEIGYWLGEKYWGQGIMTTAVKLVTKYAFQELRLKRVYAHVLPFNKGSVRVLEKAGYKYEGKLKKDSLKNNKLIDSLMFAKIK